MVGIIDYGMGNILSVYNALEMLGQDVILCKQPDKLQDLEKVILPGVGAFRDCIGALRQKGFIPALENFVLHNKKPILGICLGMQVMARRSFEMGDYQGLGWLEADVVPIHPGIPQLKVPHIGWNNLHYQENSILFAGLPLEPEVYFVHSYHVKCDDDEFVEATCEHGDEIITAAVRKGNIFATQFHPEKSQDYGLNILDNFLNIDY